MYERKDLRVLKILQKAREFNDADLSNEALVSQLIGANLRGIETEDKKRIAALIQSLIKSKEAALLSK
ncbi:hypothetical protein [Campylobacter sp.]|uniref:hypothetical protein n=1 Tax=Campylobacter sp. TaxID=205 RepID=UPI0026DC5AE7|nr:hypothetical protein [Campylobacter sp.]MDO4674110.1 hypothetical protein [Campylobacter sp.]